MTEGIKVTLISWYKIVFWESRSCKLNIYYSHNLVCLVSNFRKVIYLKIKK